MMERDWISEQMRHEVERGNTPSAVRDLASLIIVDMYLSGELGRLSGGDDVRQDGHRYAPGTAARGHLTKEQAEHWVRHMRNADGSMGGRWTFPEIKQYAQNFGITGENRVIEFYAVINAMASDYGKVAKKFGVDKAEFYAEMAKAWMDDDDAVPGKAMAYYEYIVEKDDK